MNSLPKNPTELHKENTNMRISETCMCRRGFYQAIRGLLGSKGSIEEMFAGNQSLKPKSNCNACIWLFSFTHLAVPVELLDSFAT